MCLGVRVNVMVRLGPTLAPTLTFILEFGLFPGVQYGRDILRPVTAGLVAENAQWAERKTSRQNCG